MEAGVMGLKSMAPRELGQNNQPSIECERVSEGFDYGRFLEAVDLRRTDFRAEVSKVYKVPWDSFGSILGSISRVSLVRRSSSSAVCSRRISSSLTRDSARS